jgi:hypothetical protein
VCTTNHNEIDAECQRNAQAVCRIVERVIHIRHHAETVRQFERLHDSESDVGDPRTMQPGGRRDGDDEKTAKEAERLPR